MSDDRPTLDRYSVQEAAERLGVGPTTIKTWAATLGIDGDRNAAGKRYFTPEQFQALATVAALRAEDKGLDTITRVIGHTTVNQPTPDRQVTDDQPSADRQLPAVDLDTWAERLTATVTAAIRSDNELAEKYAHAAHRIGTLEEQVRALQEREQRLLTAGEVKDSEVEAIKSRLEESERARTRAEAALETFQEERAKPWWRKLIGG